MQYPFIKMSGAGNEFIIFDARQMPFSLSPEQVIGVAARQNVATKGCDQVIVLAPSKKADVFMKIYNADGGEVDACGNATRCVGAMLAKELGKEKIIIETVAGPVEGGVAKNGGWANMGKPKLNWQEIPLAHEADTLNLPIYMNTLPQPAAVSMGNPHMIFFVSDVSVAPVSEMGSMLEHHPLYPKRANVSFAQVNQPDDVTLRVWERGAGLTKACGTAACAALVAASRRGLTGRKATIHAPGGDLGVEWRADGSVVFEGPIACEFDGTVEL